MESLGIVIMLVGTNAGLLAIVYELKEIRKSLNSKNRKNENTN
ncbi:Uncharacterised protein [Chryseobacterium carnipullorum]|uniref:Uncharacterized protein n=1 Tax=Chryseobacterium carnipullorum TaxID=1124835 RepID=A0A376DU44_CHRCU|nr:Uncharacterised protein [Chryseobacterium carnipullorum]